MERLDEVLKIRKKYNYDSNFKEEDHPRDKSGKFTSGSGSPKTSEGRTRNSNKTSAGTSYPKTKDNAKYTKALDNVERVALEDEASGMIKHGKFENVVSRLTENDITYQKDVNGNKIASVIGLAAKVDNDTSNFSPRMKRIFNSAVEDGMRSAKDMVSAAGENNMYMDSLENNVKGASHILEKAQRKLREESNRGKTVEEIAEDFGDVVRYTGISPNKDIVKNIKGLCSSLEKRGYEITEIDNKFVDDDGKLKNNAVYYGVHIFAQSSNGRNIEIQVHSEESMAIKDKNHEDYEKSRKLPENSEERNALNKQMADRWKSYERPDGIETLKSFKKS